jgi:hypothetical protein
MTSLRWRAPLFALVAVAVGLNALKFVGPFAGGMMWPYWAVTYRHGFVRRGLMGTLFQGLVTDLRLDEQQRIALGFHYALASLLAVGFVAWGMHLAHRRSPRERAIVFTGTAALFLSASFPTLGDTAGYFDVYVIALAAGGAYLVLSERPLLAGLLTCVGPPIHDSFVFLWAPVLVCATDAVMHAPNRRREALRLSPTLLPVLATVLTLAFHSRSALAASLQDLPSDWRGIEIFEMPLAEALRRMFEHLSRQPGQVPLAALFYGWPAAVTAVCAAVVGQGRRRHRVVMAVLVTVAPCSILFVAWDLSRFLVWSNYGAFTALAWAMRGLHDETRAPRELSRPGRLVVSSALVMLALLASGGPACYSYFEYTFASYKFGPTWQRYTPAAHVAYAWLGIYNKRELLRSFATTESCPTSGVNVRIAERCVVTMKQDAFFETRPVALAPGSYTLKIEVAPVDECLDASGELAVFHRWRLGPTKPFVAIDAEVRQTATLEFTIDAEESAMGNTRFGVTTHGGCFELSSLIVRPAVTARRRE